MALLKRFRVKWTRQTYYGSTDCETSVEAVSWEQAAKRVTAWLLPQFKEKPRFYLFYEGQKRLYIGEEKA
jgi:hypothetical protein